MAAKRQPPSPDPKDEKVPGPANIEHVSDDASEAEDEQAQKTLIIRAPSKFEEVVDSVLKKHKL